MKKINLKKIALIEPKSPGIHVFSRIPIPRLGLPILGTILSSKGFQVKIYVEDLNGIDFEDVYKSDLVGISSITTTAPRSYEIAKKVRERGIPVVLGGAHNTFLPDEGLENADFVVRGEAEETFEELIDALVNGRDMNGIPGLSFMKDGLPVHNPSRPLNDNLNLYPVPDLSLIQGYEKMKVLPVSTSRGCPFNCNFCTVTAMNGKNFRFRDHELILEELKKANGRHVFFCDDNFTANKERTKVLLEYMLQKNILPEWSAQVRVDVVNDPDLLKLMKRANCYHVYIGFESINPNTLKLFKKGQGIEQIENSISKLHKAKIQIHGMFIFGSDEDTKETIRETVKFAKRLHIDSVQFMILTPLPGSQVYENFRRESRLLTYDWSLYDAHHVVYVPKKITPLELQTETVKAMKSFYSWGQIFKRVMVADSFNILLKMHAKYSLLQWDKLNHSYMKQIKTGVPYENEEVKAFFPFLNLSKFKTIGIPGASLHLGSREFLNSFFKGIGINFRFVDLVKDAPLMKGLISVPSDSCLPVKFAYNQLAELKDKVDLILFPEIKGINSGQHCTKLSGLAEIIKSLKEEFPPIINFSFDSFYGPSYLACSRIGLLFTRNIKKIHLAYQNAVEQYKESIIEKLKIFKEFSAKRNEKSLNIAFLSPSYIMHNSYLSGPILNYLNRKDVNLVTDKLSGKNSLMDGALFYNHDFFCSSGESMLELAMKFDSDSTIDGILVLGSDGCLSFNSVKQRMEGQANSGINKPVKLLQLGEDLNFDNMISDVGIFLSSIEQRKESTGSSNY